MNGKFMRLLVRIVSSLLLLISSMMPAMAIDWPVSYSDAQVFGESTTPQAIELQEPDYELQPNPPSNPGLPPSMLKPYAAYAKIYTPFKFSAFAYSERKASYKEADAELERALRHVNYIAVDAYAWSSNLHENDDMVVVLKQNGNVIRSSAHRTYEPFVTSFPEVGYRTHIKFNFLLSSFDFRQPFTVVIANARVSLAPQPRETSWDVDPTSFR